jgi:hypothetical protein
MSFVVAKRILDEEDDVVTLDPVFFIIDVPSDTDAKELKDVLEKSGEALYHCWNWREFRVISEEDWKAGKWSIDPEKWIEIQHDGDDNDPPWASGTTFDQMADSILDEHRISLRLPMGLYITLLDAASHKGVTLNSFCIGALASRVDYGEIEEFEKLRRKPGRPKKVQDSE